MKKKLLLVLILANVFFLYSNESPDTITLCSFNIKWLGHYKSKRYADLVSILKDYDIVIIQELVSAPYYGVYPDGEEYTGDEDAQIFFFLMTENGFSYVISEEDTGTIDVIHKKTSSTEWWVAFYKPEVVEIANDLPSGFLADDRSNHPNFERVPYAFPFRTSEGFDFSLISVHLQPGDSRKERERRAGELHTIEEWVVLNSEKEKDIFIVGDMNLYTREEVESVTPEGYVSLNLDCMTTTTKLDENGIGKPYDHFMYNVTESSGEIDLEYRFEVINLVSEMEALWDEPEPYIGNPYIYHDKFSQLYSDHNPVVIRLFNVEDDD
ncbi:hypothetical protein [Spirochaeta isovalerica]|uniref:Endonuclease/exonuclease/phosphatase family metal-dependent hydrolase n=1 Tax=Spirochaeta isovalerica TaxID=150 RepID=A0A841RCX7_9SPIO|nr:hypothetical protein [Spirochaeta isovalerica]MBB6481516.1 endonuclease/exonuclease/phosphatase family metal-dependent hydrolase [Spirochaeta isovalerica]